MLAEKSLSWSSTTHWSHFSTTTQVLWMLDTQAKSEHSQAYVVSPLKIAKEVVTHQHEKISTASTLKAELFYTWLCKPSMLRSSRLARMSPPKHTLFTFRTKVHTSGGSRNLERGVQPLARLKIFGLPRPFRHVNA